PTSEYGVSRWSPPRVSGGRRGFIAHCATIRLNARGAAEDLARFYVGGSRGAAGRLALPGFALRLHSTRAPPTFLFFPGSRLDSSESQAWRAAMSTLLSFGVMVVSSTRLQRSETSPPHQESEPGGRSRSSHEKIKAATEAAPLSRASEASREKP